VDALKLVQLLPLWQGFADMLEEDREKQFDLF
jgi:hypothetical protein